MATTSTKAMKSIHSLEYFCDMTIKAFSLETFPTHKILGHRRGWSILADEWELLSEETDLDVISDILSMIKWGKLPRKVSNDFYIELVGSACEELMLDTPAYRAWTRQYYFRLILLNLHWELDYRTMVHPYCITYYHHRYVECEMSIKLRRYPVVDIPTHRDAARYIEQYRRCIIKLVPNAQYWSAETWLDEHHILDEILRVHNVDYCCNSSDYFCLIRLLKLAKAIPDRSCSDALFYFCNIKSCSIGLARAIWNGGDDATFVKILCLAEKRAEHLADGSVLARKVLGVNDVEDITYTRLCQSWLFKYVQQQLNSGNIDPQYIKKAKKAIFNISMRANGC